MLIELLRETVASLTLIYIHVLVARFVLSCIILRAVSLVAVPLRFRGSSLIPLVVPDIVVQIHQISFVHILRFIYWCLRFLLCTYNFRKPAWGLPHPGLPEFDVHVWLRLNSLSLCCTQSWHLIDVLFLNASRSSNVWVLPRNLVKIDSGIHLNGPTVVVLVLGCRTRPVARQEVPDVKQIGDQRRELKQLIHVGLQLAHQLVGVDLSCSGSIEHHGCMLVIAVFWRKSRLVRQYPLGFSKV